jgi:hypothetical protein
MPPVVKNGGGSIVSVRPHALDASIEQRAAVR